jgi:integral membrane protein
MDNNLLKTPIGRLRVIGIIEGISFLVLLCIAMPLKYIYGIPMAVKIVGWLHGVLFVAYIYILVQVMMDRKWSLFRAGLAFISSLIPFGTFIFDSQLKKEQEAI